MKSNFKIRYVSLILLSLLFYSCHKEGIGGKSSLDGTVYHHSKPIPNAIVYIKYGATDFPGTNVSSYDDHTTADASAKYQFDNLRKGNYYLYGVGYDDAIFATVSGGVAIKLKYNKSASTDVPVTE